MDALTGERLPQGPDERDGPGHGGFVEQVDAALTGEGPQRHALGRRQQRLVGGDHRFPGVEGGAHQGAGGLETADELDHHVDRRVGHQTGGVGGQQATGDVIAPRGVDVTDGDTRDDQSGTGLHGQGVGPVLEDPHQGTADIAAAEDGDTQGPLCLGRRGHPVTLPLRDGASRTSGTFDRPVAAAHASRRTRSSSVSRRTTVRAVPPATNSTAGRGTLL